MTSTGGIRRGPPFLSRRVLTAVLLTTTVPAYGGPGIITDGSVGAGQTIAGVNAGAGRFVIPQALGSVVGNNLFHSFSRFNIDTGQMADFTTSTASLANVVSRVTGGTTSQINGTLKLSAAGSSAPAFFFINPAGVVFGAGAAVNVPGAFHISTADYLKFANGDKFYADLRQASTLSSAAPEAFGFLGTTRASIEVRDRGSLAMKPGQPICIVAGDVEIDEATVSTRGGDTRVVAVGKAAQEIGFTGALPATSGELKILNAGTIDSRSTGTKDSGSIAVSAGDITIDTGDGYDYTGIFNLAYPGANAGPVNVRAGSIFIAGQGSVSYPAGIFSQAWYGSGNAGSVEVSTTGSISLVNGGQISADTFSGGNAGNVTVHARSISIDGQGSYVYTGSSYGYTGIFSNAYRGSTGNAGSVEITTAGKLDIKNGGTISADTFGVGNAGSIKVVTAGNLSIDNGGTISSSTWGSGDAGYVEVSAGSIAISNQEKRGTSGIFSTAEPESTGGKAGNINVTAKRDLAIDNGGVSSSTASSGDAGSVTIDAGSISINHFGTVASETSSSGDAGRVKVNAADITLSSGGGISSSTSSSSDAGTVTVNARDITIDGLNQTGFPTGIFSQSIRTDGGPGGLGGDIAVIADTLSIIRFGTISAETASNGRGGSIDLQVKYLALTEGGTINAMTSGTGNAGDIRIHDAEDVRIRGVSDVAFQRAYDNQQVVGQPAGIYLNSQGSGNGGNLQLTTRELTVQDGGLISAVAVDGSVPSLPQTRAGNICIDAGTIVLAGGGAIDASTSGAARAGSITVNADTSIDISGKFDRALHPTITNNPVSDQSHIGSSATYALNKNAKTLGAGGDVTISTPRLTLRNGGQIGVNTEGAGRAGSIGIDAGTLIIDGDSSGINAAAIQGSSGQTGSVTVTANDITLSNNGQISIENNASVDANVASTLSPTSISVTSPRITILNSPHAITTESTGNVAAGDIRISASEKLYLDPSGITTTANDGNGGAIDIRAGQIWLQNSQIATSVLGTTTGNGGDITINADTLIMNTGFIQANTEATNASGGRVSITVNNLAASGNSLFIGGNTPYTYLSSVGIFGFNVIQAAAPTGVSGTVQLSTPSLDVTAGLIGLDTHPITAQVARHLCENSSGSSLVPVGRGGLPPGGADLLSPGQISGIGFVSPPTVALPLLMHASGPMPFHSPCLAAL